MGWEWRLTTNEVQHAVPGGRLDYFNDFEIPLPLFPCRLRLHSKFLVPEPFDEGMEIGNEWVFRSAKNLKYCWSEWFRGM